MLKQGDKQAGFCNICGQLIHISAEDGKVYHSTSMAPKDHEPEMYIPGVQEPRMVILSQDQADRITQFLGLIGDEQGAKKVQELVKHPGYYPQGKPEPCHWCRKDCGGTCLGLTSSQQMKSDDPAYFMLKDGHATSANVYDPKCYICKDPEFAQMGLPLCQPCQKCSAIEIQGGAPPSKGHIPADDTVCTVCGHDLFSEADL